MLHIFREIGSIIILCSDFTKKKICSPYCIVHSVEKREISSYLKNISSNQLINLLVNPLLSRNFCQKCVRENSRNFHTVLRKLRKFSFTEEIFRQITYLVISLVKLLLSRNFCQKCVRVNYRNFHTVVCHAPRFFRKNSVKLHFTTNWFDGKNMRISRFSKLVLSTHCYDVSENQRYFVISIWMEVVFT